MISVQTIINAPIDKVWEFWTLPEHIVKWNSPSKDWHTTFAENDSTVNGKFKYTMKIKDGNEGFDFEGIYTQVKPFSLLAYKLSDNRIGSIHFEEKNDVVVIIEEFEPNVHDSESMQQEWCQSVIDHFKEYVETH